LNTVYKAYTPTVECSFNEVAQVSAAALLMVPVSVSTTLAHRKIWALAWSVAGTFAIQADLVGMLHGSEVLALPIVRFTTAASNFKFYAGWGQVTTRVGAQNENVYRYVSTTEHGLSPWRLNVTADQFAIRVNQLSGGPFDFFLMVQSQQGI